MAIQQTLVIGSTLGLILTALPALASPKPANSPQVFSAPTFERQPLSSTLGAGEYWKTVAHNAFLAQDYWNSIIAYGKAIDLARMGDRPELLEERGWVHYRLGQFRRADEDFRKAASLHLQQEQWRAYNNVRQMRQFVSRQADSASS